ncbi:MAG: ATP-binding SpoIIE family protein phosphatase [Planctomycetota bacterium]|jgi:sigma-B regulation protein RsbU (phosphoserine phosphatase)
MQEREKILVVDDERFNINVLADLLKPHYKVMAAINGEQALKAAGGAKPPDLILLDIMMPEMDGYEVCRRLKESEATRDIPVIFVTAMGQEEDETRGLELGAVDYLTKPISPSIVEARVKTHLALKRTLKDLRAAYDVIEAQKDRMQDELDVAREIQMGMLRTDFPETETYSVRAVLEPAREVGGDLYDFFAVDANRLCFAVGDVSGKGVPAALFMAMAKTLIKSRAKSDPSPASILTHANEELERDNERCMFLTAWLGILDVNSGIVTYTNAGHNRPYVCRPDGGLGVCEAIHGPVVGAAPGVVYGESTLRLDAGDQLLLYTDGVTEARSPSQELYTDPRLEQLLKTTRAETAAERVQTTVDDVWKFQADAEQADDVTVMALQFFGVPKGREALEIRIAGRLEEIQRCNEEFAAFGERLGLASTVLRSVGVALDDLLNNVVSYAFDDDAADHEIVVRAELGPSHLTIEIEDDGRPFNPFGMLTPDTTLGVEEREIGGLGIHLVRNLMDEVAYTRRTDRNVVTLQKSLGAGPEGDADS